MALQPIPLNCASSTLCRSSSMHSLLFQHQAHVAFKFRVSSSNQIPQVQTQQQVKIVKKQKKNSHRPSFFHQIQDKWSHKSGSQREKFPWQESPHEEEQRQHHHQQQPQKEERREKLQNMEKPRASNFQFPKRFSPWPQAVNPSNARFASESYDSEEEDAEGVKGSGGSVGEGREGTVSKVSNVSERVNGERKKRRSNTLLAERTIPEHELGRLRKIALRTMERFDVGVKGITQELVALVHQKWRDSEVVKFKFGIPLSTQMKKAHQLLESKIGGIVIWRSGSSIVLYRGMTYKFPCVELYKKVNHVDNSLLGNGSDREASVQETVGTAESFIQDSEEYLKDMSENELMEMCDLNHLLDELGPRFIDWTGRQPLPVDADLLPAVVPGYKTPFRLLPYGLRPCLTNKEMTNFRRLARTTAPHFALGRSRDLQGIASAMVKLWETSAIAKIAIKRGVPFTNNDRMAEELGVLLVNRAGIMATLLLDLIEVNFYCAKESI